jgi:16S rRNA (guanine966-N2)-methyltransferase
MKDRVREAVFNLIGPAVRGTHVLDLFAGTGALAFEALSRGAARATLFEQHLPTIRVLQQNAVALAVEPLCEVLPADVFIRVQGWRPEGELPWLVFSSPPYDFYVDRREEMLRMLTELVDDSPPESTFVVESDDRFDFGELPEAGAWRERLYAPAKVGIYRKGTS